MNRSAGIIIYLGLSGYFTAAHMADFRLGLIRWFALGAFLIVGGAAGWRMRRNLASPVDKATAAYLLLCLIGFWIWPDVLGRVLAAYPIPLLYAVFILGTALPPLFGGDLFTMFWAKRGNPPAVWETDIFKSINLHMTWVWAGLFLLSGLVSLVPALVPGLDSTLWRLVIGLGGPGLILLGMGVPFNTWYPGHYQRRMGIEPLRSFPAAEEEQEPPDNRGNPALPLQAQTTLSKEERMTTRPLVLAVNGSPRPDISNTGILIEMFRAPLDKEGFDLEVINLAEKKINYCLGDAWCLDKGQCWQRDDQKAILSRILKADALILGSPVYIMNVTAQMKTFLDRSLPLGHKPRDTWKPGLTVAASAGLAETEVADYLAGCLRMFGAFSLGSLTAMGSGGPDELVGREHALTRASDLAQDLARAVRKKRRLPATDKDLRYFHFMGDLIKRSREFMRHDYEHWEKLGIFDNFGAYVQQEMSESPMKDPELRKAWFKQLMSEHKGEDEMSPESKTPQSPAEVESCRQLIEIMPLGFQAGAAGDLKTVLQFEISGNEDFTAHLAIADGKAVYHDGPAENPDLTIKSPADVWMGISKGEINGQMAFMTGKFKAKGDLGLLMKLNSLFKG